MEVSKIQVGDVFVVVVKGKLDTTAAKQFENTITEIVKGGGKRLLIDFEDLDFISSSGLRICLMYLKHITKIGGKFGLSGMNELIFEVFSVSGFTKLFTIYKTREEALADF